VDPLIIAAIVVVLLLAIVLGRVVTRRPRHTRSDAEWRGALDRLHVRHETNRADQSQACPKRARPPSHPTSRPPSL